MGKPPGEACLWILLADACALRAHESSMIFCVVAILARAAGAIHALCETVAIQLQATRLHAIARLLVCKSDGRCPGYARYVNPAHGNATDAVVHHAWHYEPMCAASHDIAETECCWLQASRTQHRRCPVHASNACCKL
jgi:hypothetical protein